MYSDIPINLDGKQPVFWKGSEIPKETLKNFFILRIEVSFCIKQGHEPFARYKEFDWLRNITFHISENNNYKDLEGTILTTSYIHSSKDGKYHKYYKDSHGSIKPATVILTLGKDDFELFKERYYIDYLKVLDGCYFK